MAALKLLSLLALLALLALSSGPVHVNALVADRAQVARHAHDAIAKRKRSDSSSPTSSGRCKPRPSSSLLSSLPTSAPTPSPTPSPTPTTPPPAPSTTSAPAPSSTSTGGGQWGLAWPNGDEYLSNFATLSKVKYLYTWSPMKPSTLGNYPGIEFMPMLWGTDQISQFQQTVVPGYANYVLGFNEPNEPSQSNLGAEYAAQLWMEYINPLKDDGYTLLSPACTDDDSGLTWYSDFFAACKTLGCQIDGICFHAYTTSAQFLIDYANTLHNTYGLDVWLTEFADQNYSGTGGQPDMNEVWDFAGQVVSFAAGTPWFNAFPFGAMLDLQGVDTNNALMDSQGDPTALGYFYLD